jgi:hypothetical protein
MPSAKDIFRSESSFVLKKLPERPGGDDVLMLEDDEDDAEAIAREQEKKDIIA